MEDSITLTVTPFSNVSNDRGKVIDDSKITTKKVKWDEPLTVYDVIEQKETNVIAHSVSLYDHKLIVDSMQYQILHFLSK
jgi:hypothetical protein